MGKEIVKRGDGCIGNRSSGGKEGHNTSQTGNIWRKKACNTSKPGNVEREKGHDKTTSKTVTVETDSVDAILTENEYSEEIQKEDINNNEYVPVSDLKLHPVTEMQSKSGMKTENTHGGDGIEGNNSANIAVTLVKYRMCRRSSVVVEKLGKSILEMNYIIRSLNDGII